MDKVRPESQSEHAPVRAAKLLNGGRARFFDYHPPTDRENHPASRKLANEARTSSSVIALRQRGVVRGRAFGPAIVVSIVNPPADATSQK
jgi:hypothetical protein